MKYFISYDSVGIQNPQCTGLYCSGAENAQLQCDLLKAWEG